MSYWKNNDGSVDWGAVGLAWFVTLALFFFTGLAIGIMIALYRNLFGF